MLLLVLVTPSFAADAEAEKNLLRFHFGLGGSAVEASADGESRREVAPSDHFRGTVEMRAQRIPFTPTLLWYAIVADKPLPVTAQLAHQTQSRERFSGEGGSRATVQTVASWVGDAVLKGGGTFNLQIDLQKKTYALNLGLTLHDDPVFVTQTTTVTKAGHPSLVKPGITTTAETISLARTKAGSALFSHPRLEAIDQPLTSLQGQVTGTTRIALPRPHGWKGEWNIYCDFTWDLNATLPPLELDVTSESYSLWRPTAAVGPKPGKPIEFTAKLTDLDGKPPTLKVRRFEWELTDTSREPGIALNFPLASTDMSPDLRFVPGSHQSAGDPEGQKIGWENPESYTDRATVEPLDWGGWSNLEVRAIMEDGSVVIGKMRGQPGAIRLPRRAADSVIADHWKTVNFVTGPDDHDNEQEPRGQPGAHGDGFTLYEEYRGFYEGGKHIEGDPRKKDFFILNLVGADAVAGIDLFEDITGFVVHARLRGNEMSERTRLMNGNHARGPHRVDQHGVWIKTMGRRDVDEGAYTVLNKAVTGGRPGLVRGIGIRARDDADTAFSRPFNLAARDAFGAYERAVAHELLHSVGAEHHGSGDGGRDFFFIFADDPRNKTGKPVFFTGWLFQRKVGYITEEATGRDLATLLAPKMEAAREAKRKIMWDATVQRYREGLAQRETSTMEFKTAEELAAIDLNSGFETFKNFRFGAEHGEQSGNEQCIMRYYFAEVYEKRGSPDNFYLIPPGSDRIGLVLCRSAQGTGINASAHPPQSRFGDAAASFGNCADQICPNDAVPPRKNSAP